MEQLSPLLQAAGGTDTIPPVGIFGGPDFQRLAPMQGDIVQVRQRQYLVEDVRFCPLFRELYWPYAGKAPELFYDPRTADRRVFASLHAKCLIVDDERVLITSANFTGRGQERNIEVGALIHDRGYAGALEHQWNNLVESGDVVRG